MLVKDFFKLAAKYGFLPVGKVYRNGSKEAVVANELEDVPATAKGQLAKADAYGWTFGDPAVSNPNDEIEELMLTLEEDGGNVDGEPQISSYQEVVTVSNKWAREYGIQPNRQLLAFAKELFKRLESEQTASLNRRRRVTANDELVEDEEVQDDGERRAAVVARMLLAGLQVKAGNPNKARRLLAEFEPEELEDAAEDVVDLVEQASDEEDPFLLGEEANVEEVTEDDFDLSPEDEEEADLDDDVDDVDDIDQDDQDLPPPAVQARLRRQTASLRQRNNNARLIQMASVGKRRIGNPITAGFLTDDELDAMEEEHGYDVIGFLGKQCIALSKKYLLPEAKKGGLFTTNGRSNVSYKTDDGCRITIALAPNGISASFDSPTNQWISADVGRLASTKDLALWQKELKRATKDKEAYDEFTRIAKAILNLAKSGKISFDAPD